MILLQDRSRIRSRLARLVPLLIVAGTMTTACDVLASEHTYVIRVDSITAPTAIGAAEPLEVQLHGWVGSDGCSRLSDVEKRTTTQLLEVRFHGVRRRGDCTQMPVLLEHTETLSPPFGDLFTIRVLQPSGVPMEHTVRVWSP